MNLIFYFFTVIILQSTLLNGQEVTQKNLKDILTSDGRIIPDSQGSFSTNGYQMSYGASGEPTFTPLNSSPFSWDTLGGVYNNIEGQVHCIVINGSDKYVGGSFTNAGGNPNADYIARWDGSSWNALGTELNGIVFSVAISGNDVYVGGSFTDAGGNPDADRIARWDGSNWNAVGSGLNDDVNSIAISGNDVYIGGFFRDAGGNPNADCIVKWDGSNWNAMGVISPIGVVNTIMVSNNDVYIGGIFGNAGGNPNADYIAKWDGSNWNALGSGLSSVVNSIAISGNDVYAGGQFTDAGGNPNADFIARWDGSNWNALGTGLNYIVYSVLVFGNDVYVGGGFYDAGGNPDADRIARWDGNNWNALGLGFTNNVLTVVISGNEVYAGGVFIDAGGNPNADCIARWDGTDWNTFYGEISGLTGQVFSVGVSGTDVYVSGDFLDAGGNPNAEYIAKWDGSNWNALGTGLNYSANTIASSGNDIYIGGSFTNAGGNPDADRIARWDGSNWNALGTGLNYAVYTIAISGNDVYVGGSFTDAGGNPNADYIARWDGSSWNALGTGLNFNVFSISVSGNDVYVGGGFTDAGGNPDADCIARWDGSSWNALGTGLSTAVRSIAISGNDVYVGGGFIDAGGNPDADRIARWDGSNWNALGTGLNSVVYTIAPSGNDIYVSGLFSDAGGNPDADRIARWDGNSWNELGSGLNSYVNSIVVSGSDLFVGGNFRVAGNHPSAFFERWFSAYTTVPSAVVSKQVTIGIGLVNFNSGFQITSLSIEIDSGAGSGNFHSLRFEDTPVNTSGIMGEISNYRWIIQQNGLAFNFTGEVRFKISEIPNNGITNPNSVTVYSRPTPGSGTFSPLSTSFDLLNGELVATVSDFGEFAFGIESFIETFSIAFTIYNSWNLVSFPGIHPNSMEADTLFRFRDLSTSVFSFSSSGYNPEDTLKNGIGYWIKHNGQNTYNWDGTVQTGVLYPQLNYAEVDSFDGSSGWNIIGVYDYEFLTSELATNPSGLISGTPFEYNPGVGYQPAVTMQPGKGYWINLSADGQIIYPDRPVSSPKLADENIIEDNWASITISDAEGKQYTLYSTPDNGQLDKYFLPPKPPMGMFDVRYTTDRFVDDISSEKVIDITGAEYPIRIKVMGMNIEIKDAVTGKLLDAELKEGEEIVISDEIMNKLTVSSTGENLIEYELAQNYPNPFNPITTIKYQIASDGFVTLKVYDILGKEVTTLVNEQKKQGKYEVNFDAVTLASGIYFYQIKAGEFIDSKKMILIK